MVVMIRTHITLVVRTVNMILIIMMVSDDSESNVDNHRDSAIFKKKLR